MASVYANVAIDLYSINLHGLLGGTAQFFDNVDFGSYLGNTYQDAYRLQTAGGPSQRGYLLGTGITVDLNTALIGGTLQAFQQDSSSGSAWTTSWGIEGVSISAVTVWNAIQSPGSGDELALIESLLSGADLIRLSPGSDDMRGYAGNDTLLGGAGNDTLFGDEGNDTIEGGDGADRLYGNAGTNRLVGGSGNDTYYVGSGDTVIESSALGSEQDTVRTTGDFALSSNVEVLILDGSAIRGTGSAQDNTLVGNGENNVLSGGAGDDWLRGSLGNDSLYGGSGSDQLLGGAGADRMVGDTGNDSYEVDDPRDVVVETSTRVTEIDKVATSVSHALTSNVEQLVLSGTASINGTGNVLANQIVGNTAANVLNGLDGNDQLLANPGNDTLYGGGGNDTLDGGLGSDSMVGGSGNDRYQVDDFGDRLTEAGASTTEIDTVWSNVSFTLGAHLEHLLLQGDDAIAGTGNALANSITGNGAANRIDGRGGADTMTGGVGNDLYVVDHSGDETVELAGNGSDTVEAFVSETLGAHIEILRLMGASAINGTGNSLANRLTGNAAANTLNGGMGADTMLGGAGNDLYVVDNAADKVYETLTTTSTTDAGGTDKVNSSISFDLAAYSGVACVEALTLIGSAAIRGIGNALANTLVGNGAANVLRGAVGNDVLVGAGGADTLYGDGHDDLLRGGAGNDLLYGGTGSDCFRFDSALSTSSVQNVDQIKDFNPLQDTIQLENSIFTKFGTSTTGAIDPAYFRANSSGLAEDRNDYIIYETDTGRLFYDANGSASGGSVQIAWLQTHLALTSADYVLV